MSIYGLADCNNFFVSCERVFRPALEGRPAVVLSSNDGCIVARSDEAKALGVKMAQPAFQAKDLIERHSIAVISGNLQFYTDMSNRVMQAFGELVPAVEKYSIDECFLDLTGIPQELTAFCQDLKRTVWQWTGLPISIGIAETKTLAKIANRLAKTSAKTDGVLDLTGERWRDRALASTEVGDVWGIGRQYAKKLNRNGVMTALDLTSRPDGWIRKEMGVGGLKTVRELRGEDCIGFDDMPQPKQTTMVSRSFGTEVRDYDKLSNAITMFATDAARSIRTANLVASSTSVFIETNRFGKSPHHAPSRSEALSPATNNTKHIVRAALAALKHIYREGLAYKRAGVMLLDLVEAGRAPISLFDTQDPRDDKLIEAFDAINDRLGPGAIQFGPAAQAAAWRSSTRSARPSTQPVGKTSRRLKPEPRQTRASIRAAVHKQKVTLRAHCLRQNLARRRENEAGAFRAAGTRARERLSPPRREPSIDPFEDGGDRDGDRGNRGAVSRRLHDRRSWGEADGRRAGSATSPGGGVPRSTAGSGKHGIAATVAGTMAGLFPGSGIGASLDKLCAARTRQAALETGPSVVPLRWRNRNTDNAGAIIPTRTYRSTAGIYCREYQLTATAGGRTGQAHGSGCRQPDGSWRVSNQHRACPWRPARRWNGGDRFNCPCTVQPFRLHPVPLRR